MRRSRWSRWVVVAAIAMSVVVTSGGVVVAGPVSPDIAVDPGAGFVGDSVSVSGDGWAPGAEVEVYFDGPDDGVFLARFTVPNGSFSGSFVVPDTPPGPHQVVGCEVPGNENQCPAGPDRITAAASFRVITPATQTTATTATTAPPPEVTTSTSTSTTTSTTTTSTSTTTTTSTSTTTTAPSLGEPSATVDRAPLVPGGTLVLSGETCPPHAPVRARIDAAQDDVLLAVSDGDGAFTGALSGPEAVGRFEVTVECGSETVVLTIDLAQSSSTSSGGAASTGIVMLFLLLAGAVLIEARPAAAAPDE